MKHAKRAPPRVFAAAAAAAGYCDSPLLAAAAAAAAAAHRRFTRLCRYFGTPMADWRAHERARGRTLPCNSRVLTATDVVALPVFAFFSWPSASSRLQV